MVCRDSRPLQWLVRGRSIKRLHHCGSCFLGHKATLRPLWGTRKVFVWQWSSVWLPGVLKFCQSLWFPVDYPIAVLGTLRSDDGDGNGDATKAIGLISKTTVLHLHHDFLYISLPSLHDYDVKMPNFTMYKESAQATTKFPLSFWTWIWFLGFNFRKVRLHLTKLVTWSNGDEDWKNANSLF